MKNKYTYKTGELIQIKFPKDILKTLDKNGCLDNLPFMPEMLNYCGKQFKILYKVEKTCVDTNQLHMAEFINDDVYFIDGLRCSGLSHDGCQRGCMIFWKEAWFTKSSTLEYTNERNFEEKEIQPLKDQLLTRKNSENYYCQSTELMNATVEISKSQRINKVYKDIKSGRTNVFNSVKLMVLPVLRKIIRKIKDQHPRGELSRTPDEELNLHPGELVEVKSLNEILSTLDYNGKNKGLSFEPDMKQFCGKRFRVRNRLDKMILEQNGKLIRIKNSVILEDVTCECYYAFGGCPRKEFQFWREIWLKRVVDN